MDGGDSLDMMGLFSVPITWVKYWVTCSVKLFQVGHAVEVETADRKAADVRLDAKLTEGIREAKEGRERLHTRMFEMEQHVNTRLDGIRDELGALMRHLIPAPRGGAEENPEDQFPGAS